MSMMSSDRKRTRAKTRTYVHLIKTGRDCTVGGCAGWADNRVGLQQSLSNHHLCDVAWLEQNSETHRLSMPSSLRDITKFHERVK